MTTTATNARVRAYEGMFLFPQAATANLEEAVEHLRDILTRHGATIESLTKWDERKLAYDIKGNKRGLYLLTYFTMESTRLSEVERDCRLSERLLRALITRADHLTPEQLKDAEGQAKLAMEMKLRKAEPGAPESEVPESIEE